MKVIPISLKKANEFVEKYHRHHNPVVGHKFSIGALDNKDNLVGVEIEFDSMDLNKEFGFGGDE